MAISKYWKNSALSGNWTNGNSWSNVGPTGVDNGGAPATNDVVNIKPTNGTGRTVTYNAGTLTIDSLFVDLTGAGTNRTTFEMPSGNLTVTNGMLVGESGRATVNHSGGTITETNPNLDIAIGQFAGSHGIYNLSGSAVLTVGRDLYVANNGLAEFNQLGGTAQAGARLLVGAGATANGTYQLQNGLLSIGTDEIIGGLGVANFTQAGGMNSMGGKLSIRPNSQYTLSGGNLVAPGGIDLAGSNGQIATFIVEGDESTVTALGASAWASGLLGAGIYIRDGATANFGNLSIADTMSGNAFVQITAADFEQTTTVTTGSIAYGGNGLFGNFYVGAGDGSSRLTLQSSSSLAIGSDILMGSVIEPYRALMYVRHNGVVTMGNGSTTIRSSGGLIIESGGRFVTAGSVDVNLVSGGNGDLGSISVDGPGAEFLQTGSAGVTIGGAASVIETGPALYVGQGGIFTTGLGGLNINTTRIVEVNGGALISNGPVSSPIGAGSFLFQSGTLYVRGSLDVGFSPGSLLGSIVVISPNKEATFTDTTTIAPGATLTINGGTFRTGALEVNGSLAFDSGTLELIGETGLTVGGGGPLGSNYTLGAGRNLFVAETTTVAPGAVLTIAPGAGFSSGIVDNQGEFVLGPSGSIASSGNFFNSGLVRGSGKLTGNMINEQQGIVRVGPEQRLEFESANLINRGLVESIGTPDRPAEVVFNTPVVNQASPTGLMVGRNNTWRFQGGFTNESSVAISVGQSDIFGDITNGPNGLIVVSGGAGVTFYDDMVQNGTFRVSKVGSTTSVAVVLGSFTGSGGTTGGGDVFFEGDLRPGNSPAKVTFDNNVSLGAGSTLEIELGGTVAGTQHDQVSVTGDLSLGGTLAVSILPGFSPAAGQTFDILDWFGTLSGSFATLDLPDLNGLAWNTSQLYTDGIITLAAAGLPGDFNNDGRVDGGDYVRWRNHLGDADESAINNNGDGGGVTIADYAWWKQRYGNAQGGGGLADSRTLAVPEPSSAAISWIAFAVFGILTIRRPRLGNQR